MSTFILPFAVDMQQGEVCTLVRLTLSMFAEPFTTPLTTDHARTLAAQLVAAADTADRANTVLTRRTAPGHPSFEEAI